MTKRRKRTRGANAMCAMEGCDNEAAWGGMCKACYMYLRYWIKKGSPTAVVDRLRRIQLWENRLHTLIPQVRTLRKRKRSRKRKAA